MSTKDVVTRLRALTDLVPGVTAIADESLFREAADEIERLRADNDARQAMPWQYQKLTNERDQLRAEIERLRGTVRCINCGCDHMPAPKAAIFECNCGTVWKMIDRRSPLI